MKLTGRVLHLVENPTLLRAQLDGAQVSVAGAAYVYGVNTDAMISGQACTLGYTGEILGPWFLENFQDVVRYDDVRNGGFQVIVGGDAYGSGSSREVAVVAHQGAGIQLVVADSFQRIFQENMVYGGVPFTTDRAVLTRLEAGEDLDVRSFWLARWALASSLARCCAGLTRFGLGGCPIEIWASRTSTQSSVARLPVVANERTKPMPNSPRP